MRKMLWSVVTLAVAVTFVIGCSKQLPTQLDVKDSVSRFSTGSSVLNECELTIGDFIWEDVNGNGVQDPGEPGIPDVHVFLFDENSVFVSEVISNSNGYYLFTNLCAGTYKVYIQPWDCAPTKVGGTSDPTKDSNPIPSVVKLDEKSDDTIDFGFVCKPPDDDCGPCAGKVTELCLKYNGTTPLDLKIGKSAKTLAFAGIVQPGQEFCFSGYDAEGTFGKEVKVWTGGKEIAKIHTSCSKPIGPGLVVGPFEVISGRSKDGGPLCPIDQPPPGDCGPCKSKVIDLCVKYNGSTATELKFGKSAKTLAFSGVVQPGEEICFSGWKSDGTFGSDVKVWANGVEIAKIHTSCSQPIGPGLVIGPIEVVSGHSNKGGPLCPVDVPPGDKGDDLCITKPAALRLQYTGSDCSATSHIQKADKVSCSGDPAGAELVRIVVSNSSTPGGGKIWFDGQVAINGEFVMSAANAGETKLGADSYAYVYVGNQLVQSLKFHTSCSQPLRRDDQFGSLKVLGVASPAFDGTHWDSF